MKAMVDIPYEAIEKAYKAIQKKKKICRVLPSARFAIMENNKWMFETLVCDDRMEGEQTGIAAECCTNCKQKNRQKFPI